MPIQSIQGSKPPVYPPNSEPSSSQSLPKHSVTDLSKKTSTNIQSLDLATTATQIQRYMTDPKNQVFVPYLHLAVANYHEDIPVPGISSRRVNTPQSSNPISCEEARARLENGELIPRLSSLEYNSLSVICDFINYTESHPEMKTSAAFRSFKPDTSRSLDSVKGMTCSSISQTFVEKLKTEENLTAHVVLERSSSTAVPNHAAVIMPCNDGILFIELLQPQRIVAVKANEITSLEVKVPTRPNREGVVKMDTIKTDFKIIQMEEDYHVQNIVMTKKDTISDESGVKQQNQSQYLLRSFANPDSPIMTRYILSEPIYPLVAKAKSNNEEIAVKISFDRADITLQRQSNPFRKVIIPFHVFDNNTQTIDLGKEPDVAKRQALEDGIKAFVGEGNTLDVFWEEFQSPHEIKNQVFLLARTESLQIMKDLYNKVKRDLKNLNPPIL